MCKRINKLNTDGSDNKIDESEDTVISIDMYWHQSNKQRPTAKREVVG